MQTQECHQSNPALVRQSERQRQEHIDFLEEQDSFSIDRVINRDEQTDLPYTILADVMSNRRFLSRQARYTLLLCIIIFVLQMLPSPLIISTVQNDPGVFKRQPCPQQSQQCSDFQQGYQTITIKKINPLQRELKYFIKLNLAKMQSLKNVFNEKDIDLNHQITWIDIYASRDGEIYGNVIYSKDGKDIYQVIFNQQALVFVGEVHILSEQSYLIKIYKLLRKVKVTARRLQTEINQTSMIGNQTAEVRNYTLGQQQRQNNTNINGSQLPGQTTQNNTNSQIENSNSSLSNSTDQSRNSSNSTANATLPQQTSNKTNPEVPEVPQVPTPPEQKFVSLSVPITVQMVRYSEFYTGMELVFRYVTFLFILYVRGETSGSPTIFHAILLLVANPLIFIEIAFPNSVTNCISNICSSIYISYLGVFLYYTRRKLKNPKADFLITLAKVLIFSGLLVTNVIRQLHFGNQAKVDLIQTVLMILVLSPLVYHLWRLFFVKSKTILHRNMLFISLTIFYLLLLFLSGYIVNYGWKKISFYLIVQTYGVQLCYLTSPNKHQKTQEEKSPSKQSVNQIPRKQSEAPELPLSLDKQQSPQNQNKLNESQLPFIPVQ